MPSLSSMKYDRIYVSQKSILLAKVDQKFCEMIKILTWLRCCTGRGVGFELYPGERGY